MIRRGRPKNVIPADKRDIVVSMLQAGEEPAAISTRTGLSLRQISQVVAWKSHASTHAKIAEEHGQWLTVASKRAREGLLIGLDKLIADGSPKDLVRETTNFLKGSGDLVGDANPAGERHQPMFTIEGGASVVVNVVRTEARRLDEPVCYEVQAGPGAADGGDRSQEPGPGE